MGVSGFLAIGLDDGASFMLRESKNLTLCRHFKSVGFGRGYKVLNKSVCNEDSSGTATVYPDLCVFGRKMWSSIIISYSCAD